ncbi:MAG: 4-(cytidine 5'-diphospho)-2-C-methyl-D-erythritol kinase [Candidatus Omnitrophota bacterium]|nr:4-(cytidine 5'-diphospho)-2-C-methyl-D-erythritol kinase [Candidatus Omnitrophota bacterium]
MNRLNLDSPAKINLYLKVFDKRPDGYYQVETIIQAIDLCDKLTLTELISGIKVSSDSKELPLPKNNLAYKAADLLIKELGINKGVDIFIRKKIPIAAGLGGGSSNAAFVILGLNQLWDLKLDRDTLMEFGKRLGTDVPFFISGYQTALASGRGDEISSLALDNTEWYCLIMPDQGLSTEKIYRKLEVMRRKEGNLTFGACDAKMLIQVLRKGYKKDIEKFLYNGLTGIVIGELPVVAEIVNAVESIGLKAVVSGSGPAVYTLVSDRKEAIKVARQISAQNRWTTYITQTYNRRK